MRAVIFDLWDTLVEWPAEEAAETDATGLRRTSASADDEFARRWQASYRASQTGPLADVYRSLGVPDEHVAATWPPATSSAAASLRLRDGARGDARRRSGAAGVKLGLISVCSEEVPAAWPETELAGLFDVETFSSDCGLMKPEPEIYLRTARALERRAEPSASSSATARTTSWRAPRASG